MTVHTNYCHLAVTKITCAVTGILNEVQQLTEKCQADLPKNTFVLRLRPEGSKTINATVVDHIIPHRGNRELFGDESN